MFALPKSDPLDILVYGIGLRLTQLAKMGDPRFKKLLENRNFTIQMGSESQDIYRTFKIENGRFSQLEGKASNPTLTIDFKDSMTGAKLLTKGDAAAFMVGIQNGDVKMSGDYSLLMWFNQVAKYIVPKVPEQLQPAVEIAKPFITKATPVAKDLCDKAMSLLVGFGILGASSSKANNKNSDTKDTDSDNKSKYFKEEKDANQTDEKSLVDTAKEKLAEVKAEVEDKVVGLKEKAEETLASVKDKAEDLTDQAKDKLEDVKADAQTKVADIKDKAEDLTDQAKDKLEDVKADAQTKVADIKDKAEDLTDQAKDKLEDVKADAQTKVADIKDKAEDTVKEVKDKVTDVKEAKSEVTTATQSKFDELLKTKEAEHTEKLTPAQKTSQELEEKHAGEKVIAENIKIDAIKDDKSPVTEVTVTRASDKK